MHSTWIQGVDISRLDKKKPWFQCKHEDLGATFTSFWCKNATLLVQFLHGLGAKFHSDLVKHAWTLRSQPCIGISPGLGGGVSGPKAPKSEKVSKKSSDPRAPKV